ncbi:MAG: polysaccharide deacetylase family protein [Patescibacteria group bacterium]|nr:polysaccharide deacetylase family protein [Patescibacteria group bacterium]
MNIRRIRIAVLSVSLLVMLFALSALTFESAGNPFTGVTDTARGSTWRMGKYAFVAQSDVNSEMAIGLHAGKLDTIIPDWYFLTQGSCGVDARAFPKIKEAARTAGLNVVALYQNNDANGVYLDQTHAVLADKGSRRCLEEKLLEAAKTDEVQGIAVSFAVTPDMKDTYVVFVRETTELFKSNGLNFYVSTGPDDDKLVELAKASDGVIVNMYREAGQTSLSEAPAPFAWFKNTLTRITGKIPRDKLMLTIGQFGTLEQGDDVPRELTFTAAAFESQKQSSSFALDPQTQNLKAKSDRQTFWLLGPNQAQDQLILIERSGVTDVGVYRLGAEHPLVWELLADPNIRVPKTLSPPPYVHHENRGEIIKISSPPSAPGSIPHGYIIERAGEAIAENTVVLTFDDGPDPQWTPRIVDLLEREKIPAAFFVVGEQVERWPAAAAQLVNPLFTIGNHSYSHPRLDGLADEELTQQVASTTEIIRTHLKTTPRYFRLTYDIGIAPTDFITLHAMEMIARQGYIFVGAGIDSLDWSMPDADKTVERIVRELAADKHIIVFHDGGGDRSRTLEILEKLIPRLRQSGYRFASLDEAIND